MGAARFTSVDVAEDRVCAHACRFLTTGQAARSSLTTDYWAQGRGVHVTGVSAAYTFKLNKNILSE
jgi:hypothetical protein